MTDTTPHPRLFVRWFVQYNPLFTASALCVLGGVLSLARVLGDDARGVIALTGVLELYQWLVIAAAALLYRRLLDFRPGVILGVIALVLLADPSLQVSSLAAHGQLIAGGVWFALFVAKLSALSWAFRLRVSVGARMLACGAGALVVLLPNARVLGIDEQAMIALLPLTVFSLGVVGTLAPLNITSQRALGAVGRVMFPRLVRAAFTIGIGGVLYQTWNATFAIGGAAMLPLVGAGILICAMRARTIFATVLLVGFATVFFTAAGELKDLGVPLILSAVLLSARHHGVRILKLGAAVGVLIASFNHRALLLAAVEALAPSGPTQWGATLLTAGFVLLPIAVLVHRRLARLIARDDALREATLEMPVSPAAIPPFPIGPRSD